MADYTCNTTPDNSKALANSIADKIKRQQGGTGTDKATPPKSGNNGVTTKKSTGY